MTSTLEGVLGVSAGSGAGGGESGASMKEVLVLRDRQDAQGRMEMRCGGWQMTGIAGVAEVAAALETDR